jgi:hypothetical protein
MLPPPLDSKRARLTGQDARYAYGIQPQAGTAIRAHQGQREEARRLLAGLLASHPVADLALPLADTLPSTWPGHMPFRATVWSWFAARPDAAQPVHPHTGAATRRDGWSLTSTLVPTSTHRGISSRH